MDRPLKFIFLTGCFLLVSTYVFGQTHKYYLANGIITATNLGSGKFQLIIDTKSGARKLQFQYLATENEMYVYELIKVDEQILSEYQRSISYLKTRTKFSELCSGKGDKLLLKVLGESEIIFLSEK